MIRHIEFSKPSYYFSSYRNENGRTLKLEELAQINFFVGANNSGKSRLLRGLVKEFFHYQDLMHNSAKFHNEDFLIALMEVKRLKVLEKIRKNLERVGVILDGTNGKQFYKKVMPNKPIYNEHDIAEIYKSVDTHMLNDLIDTIQYVTDNDQDTNESLSAEKKIIQSYFQSLMPLSGNQKFKVIYIPVLRSLRGLYEVDPKQDWSNWQSLIYANIKTVSTGSLQLRTLLDYFIEENGRQTPNAHPEYDITVNVDTIFTGENLYEQVLALRTGKESQRAKLNGFEEFLSKSFFNGEKVEINSISDERGNDVHIKIGGENEFPVYALGDGIQAIILLTFPLFFNKDEKNQMVFYEEPELFLHPGMQRIFIDVLRQFPKVQFFIATHSNHLLDTSLDYPETISIYSFEKKLLNSATTFTVKGLSSSDLSLLNLLGVRNSSVFLSNCTIWIEGISDRLYIRRYLELYMDKLGHHYKEDLHFSFLEFGGNNVIHYNFSDEQNEQIAARKITNRIFLIHDADKGKEARHELLFHQLGENYHKLSVLEIENLLSPAILQITLQNFKKPDTEPLVFRDLAHETYQQQPLTQIVNEMISSGHIQKLFSTPKGQGQSRLYDKVAFARVAISHLHRWNDLSTPAKELTKAIYHFIQKNNKG